jgi:transposase-like protein
MFGGYRAGKRGWGAASKVIVLGLLKRKGVVRDFTVTGRGRDELTTLIVRHTLPGSHYYTDDRQAYASLAVRSQHVIVSKEKADRVFETTPIASKASGAMRSIGFICIGECRKSFSIFTWAKSRSVFITAMKIYAL